LESKTKKINLAKGATYLSLAAFLFMLSGYVANVWLGRHFGPITYGQYGVIISLLSLINIMQTTGLPQALAKYSAEQPKLREEVLHTAINLQLKLTLLASIIFITIAPLLASILNDPSLTPYFRLSAIVFPIYGLFSIFVGYYNGLHEFKKQASINGIYALSKLFTIVILSLLFKLYGAVISFIISPLIALIFSYHKPLKSKKSFPGGVLIKFSFPIIIFSFLTTLFLTIDLLFVKALLPNNKSAAGYYIAAQNIALIVYFCMSAAGAVLLPTIASKISLHEDVNILINKSVRFIFIILLPIVSIMIATSSQLIKIIYSHVYLPANSSLQILLLAYMFMAVFVLLANILNGGGKPYLTVLSAIPGLVLTCLLCIILIPVYGLNGAGLSTLAGSLTSTIIVCIIVIKNFKVRLPFASIFKIAIISALLYTISSFLNVQVWGLPLLYLSMVFLYLALLILTKELSAGERLNITNILKKVIGLQDGKKS
jgi:O-antigen/teichoic acid export membrane protein